ncbi:hypothetical protein EYC84_008935 [Monilinia fructicola]|uniref:Uncharacterized protein n=1 Tax=Monilinia fructicola TaxID=38448 RepID=A0A5M9JAK9_MONFR|nr:hypothetical protein EYC84_008935 [Monilinia fructicola]
MHSKRSRISIQSWHRHQSRPATRIRVVTYLDFACAKGNFQRFGLAGFPKFRAQNFLKVVENLELLATCPDAGTTGYTFEWHTGTSKSPPINSAFANDHIHLWLHCFSRSDKAENHDIVLDFENKAIAGMRDGHPEEECKR